MDKIKLYVVTSAYWEEGDFGKYELHSRCFEGVFSNKIKAQEFADNMTKLSNLNVAKFDYEPVEYTIEEVILDND